jgi:hypothetical protein
VCHWEALRSLLSQGLLVMRLPQLQVPCQLFLQPRHRYIYTMEYYAAIKKNEIMSLAGRWMELKLIKLSIINQTDKDKYGMC